MALRVLVARLAVLDLAVALQVLLLLVRPRRRLLLLLLMLLLLLLLWLLLWLSRRGLWLMLQRMLTVRRLCQRWLMPMVRVWVRLGVWMLSSLRLRLRLRRLRLPPMPR